MPESDEERQRRALDLAFKRGGEMAEINGHLKEHDRHLAVINGSIERMGAEVHKLSGQVTTLAGRVDQNIAVQTARAEDAEKAVNRQITRREYYLGLLGAVAALGTLLSATGHA